MIKTDFHWNTSSFIIECISNNNTKYGPKNLFQSRYRFCYFSSTELPLEWICYSNKQRNQKPQNSVIISSLLFVLKQSFISNSWIIFSVSHLLMNELFFDDGYISIKKFIWSIVAIDFTRKSLNFFFFLCKSCVFRRIWHRNLIC